jgi:fused signal recognition particle receptor
VNLTELLPAVLPPLVVALSAGALAIFAIGYPRAVAQRRREQRREPASAARRGEGTRAAQRGEAERSSAELRPPEHAVPAAPAAAPPAARPDLRAGLRQSRLALVGRIDALLRGRPALDAATLAQVEEVLFGADIGVRTADDLLEAARGSGSPAGVRPALEARALAILGGLRSAAVPMTARPHVLLVVGVNGSGKTTTIGKLASRWRGEGRKVVVAAGDTYRAAAGEQLAIWAQRSGARLVRGEPGGDPAAVAFDALKTARAEGADVLIIDTAGRLQTDQGLMDQLAKIVRVVKREVAEAPHETLLVVDGSTGQNAIRQAQEFSRAVPVSGIALTKLDGTAKGGVVLGIAQEVGIPVRWVGLGERVEDLDEFSAESFVRALFAGDD